MNLRLQTIPFVLFIVFVVCRPSTMLHAAEASDANIRRWITEALREDPRVDVADIEVIVDAGIVTLGGNVDNLAETKYADAEARKIRGVLGVVNEIWVMSGTHADEDIADWVTRRISNSATVSSPSIKTSCKDGIVTLSGRVGSNAERKEAMLLASEIRGVRRVMSRISVEPDGHRSDADIQRDAEESLARDVYLTGLPVAVSVADSVVTLSGSVATAYEKSRAESHVGSISNVSAVKNQLKVELWENEGVRIPVSEPSNQALQNAVSAELRQDTRLADQDLHVKAATGHITLTGLVDSPFQKRIAELDAHNVVGVGHVTNHIRVFVRPRADIEIQTNVNLDLTTDATIEKLDLQAAVTEGVVTLRGVAHSWFEKEHATDLAARNWGVKDVINEIRIEHATTKQDARLLKTIKQRLARNAITNPVTGKLVVNVNQGNIRLEGDVASWAQRKEAAKVALLTSGVLAVDNRITVNGYDYPWNEWTYKPAKSTFRFDPFRTPYHLDDYFHQIP